MGSRAGVVSCQGNLVVIRQLITVERVKRRRATCVCKSSSWTLHYQWHQHGTARASFPLGIRLWHIPARRTTNSIRTIYQRLFYVFFLFSLDIFSRVQWDYGLPLCSLDTHKEIEIVDLISVQWTNDS